VTGHVIHLSKSIDAAPETIWGVLIDLSHVSDILRSVKNAELLTEAGEYGVGTTWREDRKFFGHHGTEELHVTESEPPRRTIHETRLGHDSVRTAYSIQPTSDGRAKLLLTATVDMDERNAAENLIWNTWGNISFEQTRRMLSHDLEDIGNEAERREADRPSTQPGAAS
jgi:hypothetical protein